MIAFMQRIIYGRYAMCCDCEVMFRKNRLIEINDGTEYVCAIVCPNCNSKDWYFTGD